MGDTGYTISELELETGLSRRTIHYYTKERLIPPPLGTGGGARYGEEHRLRLLLIQAMQKSHLKLSGIREALDAMSLDEMRSLLRNAPAGGIVWGRQDLEQWLGKGETLLEAESPPPPAPSMGNFSFFDVGREVGETPPARPKRPSPKPEPFLANLKRSAMPEPQTWSRHEIVPGVEIHVRNDVASRLGYSLHRLIRLAQRLLSRRRRE